MSLGIYANTTMETLLEETRKYSMTEEHLATWRPDEFFLQSNKKVPFCAFEKPHADAIKWLLVKKKMNPLLAVNEVSGLSNVEARFLIQSYDLGISGKFIREQRKEYNFSPSLCSCVQKLMRDEKLSLDQAVQQVKGLDCMGNSHEIDALSEFFHCGLRNENLIQFRTDPSYQILFKMLFDHSKSWYTSRKLRRERESYLRCVIDDEMKFTKHIDKALSTAAREAKAIENNTLYGGDTLFNTSYRIHFLNRHRKQRYRAADVPVSFDKETRATYRILWLAYNANTHVALREINGLNPDQIKLMKIYFSFGVNHDLLKDYPHGFQKTVELITQRGTNPRWDIPEFAGMNDAQFQYFHAFAKHGLTFEDAKALTGDSTFSSVKADIVRIQVESGADLIKTLQSVMNMTEEEAQKTLHEPATRRPVIST